MKRIVFDGQNAQGELIIPETVEHASVTLFGSIFA